MTAALGRVRDAVSGHGFEVARAWPRDHGHLLLHLTDPATGKALAGQWFADHDRAARVCAETADVGPGGEGAGTPTALPADDDRVRLLPTTGVLLQPGGADRRLPALRPLLAERGATLVAHRPERRAVVRHRGADGQPVFTKAVRREKLAGVLAAAQQTDVPGVTVPRIVSVDTDRGLLTTAALPGRTLHELLGDEGVPLSAATAACRATGDGLRALHAATVPAGSRRHDVADEVAVTHRWLALASEHGCLDASTATRLRRGVDTAARKLAGPAPAPVRLHRDLHDHQVLVVLPAGPGVEEPAPGSVGMLDFDLAAAGDAALDLANLLVHLDLRVLQGHTSRARSRACAEALIEGYGPVPNVSERLRGYAQLTRLRLVGVYAFRPEHADAVARLVTDSSCRDSGDTLFG